MKKKEREMKKEGWNIFKDTGDGTGRKSNEWKSKIHGKEKDMEQKDKDMVKRQRHGV